MLNTAECEACGGEGVVWWDAADSRGEHTTEESACETCDGTGQVEADEEQAA